ncbi:MAG: RagB/SusD family nutrient uptake outer membrane protein [Tannerella sp.]|nr:RagB/SusD family nutrient uptake outer membrane protein [Tannerella sp.]
MKKIYYIIMALSSIGGFMSCVDLDITPKNILTAQDIYSEGGIKAYMAGMYRSLPMEDFHYAANNSSNSGYFNTLNIWQIGTLTGEMCNEDSGFGQYHRGGYWSDGFKLIRQANTLINDLPNYPELATYASAWIAEAKFIRAYVYFQLVKRYGGMPIIEAPQTLDPDDESALWIARSSHVDTYEFILKDLDDAMAGMTETSEAGRANKYVAAGLKSRVALYAAATARYGHDKFPDWEVDGMLLQGIPADRAVGYFKQAWDAAKLVEGHYDLHNANADKAANFAEVWEKCDNNNESMWLRKNDYLMTTHSMDALFSPVRLTTTYGGRYGVPLDWVELFDGLPLNEEGHFSAFDEEGYYLAYDNCHQMWDAAEPRLCAQIFVPGMMARGFKIDVRSGVFNKDIDPAVDKFKKFSIDDGATNFNYRDGQTDSRIPEKNMFASGNSRIITQNNNNTESATYDDIPGMKIFIAGLDGPKMKWNGQGSTMTGILLRKFLDLSMPLASVKLEESMQSWIEMRYAEILLNRAEAAIELYQSGETNYQGVDMQQDAYECINAVRNRAGANLLTGKAELSSDPAYTNWTKPGPKGQGAWVEGPNRALQILRVERYKELANEAKIYWDLMRWFTFDTQFNQTNKRGLYSFMFTKGATVDENGIPEGKYIYDAKQGEHYCEPVTFDRNRYYEGIPSGELQNNPLLQKNRNQ